MVWKPVIAKFGNSLSTTIEQQLIRFFATRWVKTLSPRWSLHSRHSWSHVQCHFQRVCSKFFECFVHVSWQNICICTLWLSSLLWRLKWHTYMYIYEWMGPNVALESLEVVPNVDNGGSFLSISFLVTDVWDSRKFCHCHDSLQFTSHDDLPCHGLHGLRSFGFQWW
jgi:hypothetical protein